jgi:hypothetical protein
MREEPARLDRRLAEIAARQYGIVTSAQILAAGITSSGSIAGTGGPAPSRSSPDLCGWAPSLEQ